jgi:hypothetical protein
VISTTDVPGISIKHEVFEGYDSRHPMKLSAVLALGIFSSFILTLLGFLIATNTNYPGIVIGYGLVLILNPLVALTCGCLIGLVARGKDTARTAALGLAPWLIFLIVSVGRTHLHSSSRWWAEMLFSMAVNLSLGIGAAVFVGGRKIRAVQNRDPAIRRQ